MPINADLIRGFKSFVESKFAIEKTKIDQKTKCKKCGGRNFQTNEKLKIGFCLDCHPEEREIDETPNSIATERIESKPIEAEEPSKREPVPIPGSTVKTLVDIQVINAGAPICHVCLSHQYIERAWSDGEVTCKCWTCRDDNGTQYRDVSDVRKPELLDAMRARLRAMREEWMTEV